MRVAIWGTWCFALAMYLFLEHLRKKLRKLKMGLFEELKCLIVEIIQSLRTGIYCYWSFFLIYFKMLHCFVNYHEKKLKSKYLIVDNNKLILAGFDKLLHLNNIVSNFIIKVKKHSPRIEKKLALKQIVLAIG